MGRKKIIGVALTFLMGMTTLADAADFNGGTGTATGVNANAWGNSTQASGTLSTAWGYITEATGIYATAWGYNSKATGRYATAFGSESIAAGQNSLAALGGTTSVDAINSAAIGSGASATLANSIALGSSSVTTTAAGIDGYLKGTNTGAAWTSTLSAVAVGNGSTATRQITGVAAGTADTDAVNVAQLKALEAASSSNTTTVSTSTGSNLTVTPTDDEDSTNYEVKLNDNITLGTETAKKININGTSGEISIGGNTVLSSSGLTMGSGNMTTSLTTTALTLGGNIYISGNGLNANSKKVQNVLSGEVAANSTDAVNGSQLHSVQAQVGTNKANITTNTNAISDLQSAVETNTSNISDLQSAVETNTSNISDLQSAVETNTSNISDLQSAVETNTSNISDLQSAVETNTSDISDLQSAVETNTSDISDLKSAVETNTSDISDLKSAVETNTSDISNLQSAVENNASDISGIQNDIDSIKTDKADSSLSNLTVEGKAAITSIAQDTINDTAITYDDPETKDTITLGNPNTISKMKSPKIDGETKITNLKGGDVNATSTDAINGRQLYEVKTQVATNTSDISTLKTDMTTKADKDMSNITSDGEAVISDIARTAMSDITSGFNTRLNNMDSKIDKVGAGAAALAALQPLEYDSEDKLSFAVGSGSYHGQGAIAIGTYYRPNGSTMINFAASMGNGQNMYGLGVAFALDGKQTSRDISKKDLMLQLSSNVTEIRDLKSDKINTQKELAATKAEVAELKAMVLALSNK